MPTIVTGASALTYVFIGFCFGFGFAVASIIVNRIAASGHAAHTCEFCGLEIRPTLRQQIGWADAS